MNFEIAPKETEIRANWYDAKLYCFSLKIDGKSSWRLPTVEELNEIYQAKNDFEETWYWTSIESSYSVQLAWYQLMSNGYQSYAVKSYDGNYIRAIRSVS